MSPNDPKLLLVALAVALVLVLGLPLINLWLRARRAHREAQTLRQQLARTENQVREQARLLAHASQQKSSMSELSMALQPIIHAWNREDMDPRAVPEQVVALAEAVFEPAQLLFYATRPSRRPDRPHQLLLVHHKGLRTVPDALQRIDFGVGKIGWAAENYTDMVREDWLSPAKTDGQRVPDNHPSLKTDLVGPLVQQTRDGRKVLGVLVVGAPARRQRDEKQIFQLITELGSMAQVNVTMRNHLRERANTDGLTGLMNKSYFTDRALPDLLFTAHRGAQPVGLFIFDIDHFKAYNDTNGHPAGDQLLRDLGALLKSAMRPDDLCARYGGEEFVVAMPDTDGATATEIADRIRRTIEQHVFPHQEKQPSGNVTISGGVAASPHDGSEVAMLIRHADEALYRSKRSGRNRVTRFRGVNIGDATEESGFDMVSSIDDDPGPGF